MVLSLLIGSSLVGSDHALAAAPESAPAALKQNLAQLDAAASQEDLTTFLQYYSPTFANSDGVDRDALEEVLSRFWDRYSDLQYQTELMSWEQTDAGLVAEVMTTIQGTEVLGDRQFQLQSSFTTQQLWQDNQLVREDILEEENQLTSGQNPPNLLVRLPQEVKINQAFNFDVIVEEPLANDLLLGGFIDEPVNIDKILEPAEVEVVPLAAGGLFKVGRAPAIRDNRWISAVIIRKGGITMVTRRLRVVEQSTTSTSADLSS
ncbi:MAG: nuclear transport factor 2 family protein [Cyanobacteria bacterium P01_H01_bin.121]